MTQSTREYEAVYRNLRAVRELKVPLTVTREPWYVRPVIWLARLLWGVR